MNMDYGKIILVACLTLFIVLGVNAFIFTILRNRSSVSQIELFRKAAGSAKQPWKTEEEALKELSQKVNELKQKAANENSSDRIQSE